MAAMVRTSVTLCFVVIMGLIYLLLENNVTTPFIKYFTENVEIDLRLPNGETFLSKDNIEVSGDDEEDRQSRQIMITKANNNSSPPDIRSKQLSKESHPSDTEKFAYYSTSSSGNSKNPHQREESSNIDLAKDKSLENVQDLPTASPTIYESGTPEQIPLSVEQLNSQENAHTNVTYRGDESIRSDSQDSESIRGSPDSGSEIDETDVSSYASIDENLNEDLNSPENNRSSDFFTAQCMVPIEKRWVPARNITVKRREDGAWKRVQVTRKASFRPWCKDMTTMRFRYFENQSTMIRRTALGARAVLRGKNLLFVGNSMARYQYLSLVDLMIKGTWGEDCGEAHDDLNDDMENPRRSRGKIAASRRCPLSFAHLHGGFNQFYNYTTQRFNVDPSKAKETCYCYRADNALFAFANDSNDTTQMTEVPLAERTISTYARSRESRFFHYRFAESEGGGSTSLTYLSNFQDSIYLNPELPPFSPEESLSCDPGSTCNPLLPGAVPSTNYSTVGAIIDIIPKLRPTHAFVSGWEDDDIGCELVELERKHNISAWYLSLTDGMVIRQRPVHQSCGVKQLDRLSMTIPLPRTLYIDGMHVTASVNQEFNQILIEELAKFDSRKISRIEGDNA